VTLMAKSKVKILLVEDDENLGFMLQDFLQMDGYEVTLEVNGNSGLTTFSSQTFDLCILDVMLPKKDGFSLASDIRKINFKTPFIFLTARGLEEDRINGLKLGADDYIIKPFSTEELKLRIEIVLKRTGAYELDSNKELFNIGNYVFDFSNQILGINKHEKRLTKKEAMVLRLLCQNMNQLVRREGALTSIWGADDYFMGRSMDVYIAKLRSYLKEDDRVNIVNVHGSGFKLEIKEN